MNRVAFFIDGFNLYHAMDNNPAHRKYKWLNLRKLSECFIGSEDSIVDISYFTAYTVWNPAKIQRHNIYIRALRSVNVKIILGAFRPKDRICRICNKQYRTFVEKRTDVNICIKLFGTALSDKWDKAMVISGDSDLIPAIEGVKSAFPAKQIGIIIPIGGRAEELKQVSDFHMKIKPIHLSTCQFPDVIVIDEHQQLNRPASWR